MLDFKYHVSNAWRWSERPKHVACVDGTDKIYGRLRYVGLYQFLKLPSEYSTGNGVRNRSV